MTRPGTVRGRPIVALFVVLVGWVAARTMLWDSAAWPQFQASAAPIMAGFDDSVAPFWVDEPVVTHIAEGGDPAARRLEKTLQLVSSSSVGGDSRPGGPAGHYFVRDSVSSRTLLVSPATKDARTPLMVSRSAWTGSVPKPANQMLWRMAAQVGLPLPISAVASSVQAEAGPFSIPQATETQRRRWSADAWFLMRRGGNVSLATGAAPATYGASQAGGVLRYRLAPENIHRPAAYLRTTAALNGSDEKEAAVGVSARPFGKLPVRAAAEVRATRQVGGTQFRPAAMLITEFAPVRLPFGATAHAYGQAGYVAGKFSTGFADGQLTVDRGVVRLAGRELRAGGGIWGGVQKGASRLDAGPTASIGMRIGDKVSARVAADWRFRITGNAEPSSGPALTLSAGF